MLKQSQLVRLILTDYVQSQRILIECGSVVAVSLLLVRDTTNANTMLAIWTLYAVLLALYTTSVLADIAEQPFQIQRLLAIQSRRTYISAYLIAANIIVISSTSILALLSLWVAPFAQPTLMVLVMAVPSMLVLIGVMTALMLMLTPLVASTQQRIVVLLIITIPLAWNIIAPLIQRVAGTNFTALIAGLMTLWGIILWPTLHLYTITITPKFDSIMLAVICFHLGVVAIIVRQIIVWFNRKSLTIT